MSRFYRRPVSHEVLVLRQFYADANIHDPDHDDTYMAKVNKEAQEMWLGAVVTREGMAIDLA